MPQLLLRGETTFTQLAGGSMPLVRIAVPRHLDDRQLKHIADSIHESMVTTFNVPADDRFQVFARHAPDELVWAPTYLDIPHTRSIVFVQITCNEGRTVEMKKALFARLASSIASGGAILPSDVIVSLVEVKKENWTFGNGLAQYAV